VGAASIAFGFQIAIEAAVVAGSKIARRSDMANIGSFKKSGQEFQGEIVTLSLQTKGVRIVPETDQTSDIAPSHRVYVGRADYAELSVMRSGVLRMQIFRDFADRGTPHNLVERSCATSAQEQGTPKPAVFALTAPSEAARFSTP
jgi:Protein of unknown function (DUF736)